MTKEELKQMVATGISGQGNQIDLANVLPTILNEIVDMAGGSEEPTIIDLHNFGLSADMVEVTAYMPNNYNPKPTDILRHQRGTISCTSIAKADSGNIEMYFGVPFNADPEFGIIGRLVYNNDLNKWFFEGLEI